MRIDLISIALMWVFVWPAMAQETDTLKAVPLDGVVVTGPSYAKASNLKSAVPVEVAGKRLLQERFTGNLMQTLAHIPGVHSMNIGSGFAKPMIRGMGFHRISVAENGIKQEGQQWGADHGLEVDAFNVARVGIRKGPASLLYGSDAMGGVVEIVPLPPPLDNQVFGEAALLARSVNATLGGSLMVGLRKEAWHVRLRFSEQHFGDYCVPADTVVYLTQRLPLEGGRLKNTAGVERAVNLLAEYRQGHYYARLAVSNAWQKTGFFVGAHGVPDASRLVDDGNSRNIDLPYSTVNHLKVTTRQQYSRKGWLGYWDAGFQHNLREEWSRFHTHYGTQPAPAMAPDKELAFSLHTFSSSLRLKPPGSPRWEHTLGADVQYQHNHLAGYSFLLPAYTRLTAGLLWLSSWKAAPGVLVSGGLRYDYGRLAIAPSRDIYLETYLREQGYPEEMLARYRWRSYPVNRSFGDVSGSLGLVWQPHEAHLLQVNIGRSFRLPGANELAANGVHHGTFRHEQGDASLVSEQGWQLDAAYTFEQEGLRLSVTPFGSWFSHYIYLKPTGEWSVLPHAGQIYRYTGAEALLGGGEVLLDIGLWKGLGLRLAGEYVHTWNLDEHIPLTFSPPASLRSGLRWQGGGWQVWVEWQGIARQNSVSRNEDPTPGASLWHAGATVGIPLGKHLMEISLSLQNLLNTKYYSHLSFYRKVDIPEPGRNIQLLINIPFKSITQ
jgi:iron complex outermembrane receptor protein